MEEREQRGLRPESELEAQPTAANTQRLQLGAENNMTAWRL